MDDISLNSIYEAYAEHPQSANAILSRLRRRFGDPLPTLTELDLAVDLVGGITDQNHAGGLEAVVEVARALEISQGGKVLDVGCGLGGPARLLAYLHKYSVVGVELTCNRYHDALTLTALVGMDEHVRFIHGDFLRLDFPPASFDGVVLLDCVGHFRDKVALLNKCLSVCRRNGRIVIQDAMKQRSPNGDEKHQLDRLQEHWNVRLSSFDDWLPSLREVAKVEEEVDLQVEFCCHLQRLLALMDAPGAGPAVPREKQACELALLMSQAGVLGYSRLTISRL